MSVSYWMCEGVGIRVGRLFPHLNNDKCIALIKEKYGEEFVEDENEFDIDDYLYGELFQNLGDMLCHCDDTNTLSYGDNGDGEYYFYYTPSYPWDRRDNEPTSLEDVHERIKDAVQRICDLTREEIEALIDDDIYEYGCG